MTLHLYLGDKNYSSWSMRPWVALTAARVQFDETTIELDTPEFDAATTALSPAGAVPILEHDGLAVWDSLAICEYVHELFPDRGMWPAERAARARARAVVAEMHAGFASLRRELPMNIRRARARTTPISAETREDLDRIDGIFAAATGPFLFGGFGIADAFFAPVATRIQSYGLRLGSQAEAYRARLLDHPAVRAWCDAARREARSLTKYDALD